MDPRVLVNHLYKLRGRVTGWYKNDDVAAIDLSIAIIQRFCFPEKPKISKANGSKIYSCPRCNKKILRTDFWCASCGQRILVDSK